MFQRCYLPWRSLLIALTVTPALFPLPSGAGTDFPTPASLFPGRSSLPNSLPPPASSPSAVTATPSANTSAGQISGIYSGYLLGPGDQVDISVFGYAEFTGGKVVLPDGTISLPVIGTVVAVDRTPEDLRRDIFQRLNQVLVNPVVTLSLTTLRPVVVNVAGEVQRPGPLQLSSLTNSTFQSSNNGFTTGLQTLPTVSSALTAAGGVTRNADIQKIVLRRSLPGGQSTLVTVNLWNSIWSDQPPENVVLRAGDSIFIPTLPSGSSVDRRLLARSSLAPALVKVRLVGEVNRPGEIQISPDSSLSSAIASAGGPTKAARMKAVQLLRLNDKGQIETRELDLRQLNDRIQVQDGDVVIVPETGGSKFLRGLGQVLSPLGSLFNLTNTIRNF